MMRTKAILMGLAIFTTAMALSFRFDNGSFSWSLQGHPAQRALTLLAGLGLWIGYAIVRRRLRTTGL